MRFNTAILCMLVCISFVSVARSTPKNVIVFIGDGMGFEQVKAAGMYEHGNPGTLSFEGFTNQAEAATYSANSSVTDSAAAGTAIATGHKVNNGVISMAYPGDGSELQTLLEYFKDRGKSTGLVSTTYITHATPASFGAHEPSRNNYSQIADDFLSQTRPDVLFGGGSNGLSVASAESAGYTVVTDRAGMQALNTESVTMVSGQFGTSNIPYEYDGLGGLPHLSEMTTTALAILDNDPDGFFLMVEGGKIDHAGHENDIQRNIPETVEFSNTVQAAVDWAQAHSDTFILVTADHETGGLTVLANNGQGNMPDVSWTTTSHTGVNVPVYASGVNAYMVSGVMDNTDIFEVCTSTTDGLPTVSITNPQAGATVSGSVDITADASDNVRVTRVEFYIDAALKNTDTTSPYSWSWDTTAESEGTHTIKAVAYDTAGQSDEDTISVTVNITDETFPDLKAYPNPLIRSDGSGGVKFTGLQGKKTILRIYTLSGKLVYKEDIASGEQVIWTCRNENEEPIVSGLYVYVLTDEEGNEKKTGKIAIKD
jgi:alkaline phosphatase